MKKNKTPKRPPLKPIYANMIPIQNNEAGLIIMVDEIGNTYIKILHYSLSPYDMSVQAWHFIGNPL